MTDAENPLVHTEPDVDPESPTPLKNNKQYNLNHIKDPYMISGIFPYLRGAGLFGDVSFAEERCRHPKASLAADGSETGPQSMPLSGVGFRA